MQRLTLTGSSALLIAFAAGCGSRVPQSDGTMSDITSVYYEAFSAGDPVTDQGSGAPASHSSLIGTSVDDANVRDDDFAQQVAAVALRSGASLFFSLGECYSGGFLDDLAALGGTQSVITSARHTETASYAYEPPSGVDIDYTDAFTNALADGLVRGEDVARLTAAADPFGPNPDTPRVDEPLGSEHTEYLALGGGKDLRPADHAATGMAVLWAGLPAERDGTQMNRIIDHLVAMGFSQERIWLLYGSGQADEMHPVVQKHIKGQAHPVHLMAATRKQLFQLFDDTFVKKSAADRPDFVFFYVGDHGGLDGASVAKKHFGRPDLHVTPHLQVVPGTPLYGEGL